MTPKLPFAKKRRYAALARGLYGCAIPAVRHLKH